MASAYGLRPELIKAIFPFHIAVDEGMVVRQLGPATARLLPRLAIGELLADHLTIKRPQISCEYRAIVDHRGLPFVVEPRDQRFALRGQMVCLEPAEKVLLFLCSPWATDLTKLEALGISRPDFALHDATPDNLSFAQAQGAFLAEIARLEDELREHKEKLARLSAKRTPDVEAKIGARRRAETEARETANQSVHAMRLAAIGELAAGVAHELNQPLNGLKLILQSILKYQHALDATEVRQELVAGLGIIDGMAAVIDHMGTFSRRGTGATVDVVELNSVVRSTLRIISQQVKDEGIDLLVRLSPDPLPVLGNPVRLGQAVLTLISNARDSLDDSSLKQRRIEIVTRSMPASRGNEAWAIVEVRDNGPGIPDPVQERILEPFFTTKAPGKGTGLGLSIAAKIMQEHGGELAFKSDPGTDTVFSLRLRLRPERGSRPSGPASKA